MQILEHPLFAYLISRQNESHHTKKKLLWSYNENNWNISNLMSFLCTEHKQIWCTIYMYQGLHVHVIEQYEDLFNHFIPIYCWLQELKLSLKILIVYLNENSSIFHKLKKIQETNHFPTNFWGIYWNCFILIYSTCTYIKCQGQRPTMREIFHAYKLLDYNKTL